MSDETIWTGQATITLTTYKAGTSEKRTKKVVDIENLKDPVEAILTIADGLYAAGMDHLDDPDTITLKLEVDRIVIGEVDPLEMA